MHDLSRHPRIKVLLQSSSLIFYFIIVMLLCNCSITRYAYLDYLGPMTGSHAERFIRHATEIFATTGVANTVAILYFLGSITLLVLITLVYHGISALITATHTSEFRQFYHELS